MKNASGLGELLLVVIITLILIILGASATKNRNAKLFDLKQNQEVLEQKKSIDSQLEELQKAKELNNQRQLDLMKEMR